MELAEYLKGTKSAMVLISHDILQEQVNLIEKYRALVDSKDKEIANLLTHVDLLKSQKGGLNMIIAKQETELKQYRHIPIIDRRA